MPSLDLNPTGSIQLYTRYEHGNHPVRVMLDDRGKPRYEVERTDGLQVYTSARQLIAAQCGRLSSMTFDRYFKVGRHRRPGRSSGAADLLLLLNGARQTAIAVESSSAGGRSTGIVIDESVRPSKIEALLGDALPPLAEDFQPTPELAEEFDRVFRLELDRLEGVVGFDLSAPSGRKGAQTLADEVRRLLWAGFAGKMLSQGYEPEDVLQEVYRGLVVRNRGRCPWDRRKSTFGHYVYMVISCVLTNHHRKQARRADRDAVSLEPDLQFASTCSMSFGSEVGDTLALRDLARYLALQEDRAPEAVLGCQILPYVGTGHTRSEIARVMGTRPSNVSRALTWLRRRAAQWAAETGMQGHIPVRYRELA